MLAQIPRYEGSECRSIKIDGIRVDTVTRDNARGLLTAFLQQQGCHHVVTANIDYMRQARIDPRLRSIINSSALVVPDGMPIVWIARLLGAPITERVTGHDLVHSLIELSTSDGLSLFFLGAAPGVAERAASNLRRLYPKISIAGVYSPPAYPYPFPEDEDRKMIDAVNSSDADALLVALGCPKQDFWIAAHRHHLKPSIAIGVGSVLDVLAGAVSRAPTWLQSSGLEWIYRLSQEPRRLSQRYLLHDLPYVLSLLHFGIKVRLARSQRTLADS